MMQYKKENELVLQFTPKLILLLSYFNVYFTYYRMFEFYYSVSLTSDFLLNYGPSWTLVICPHVCACYFELHLHQILSTIFQSFISALTLCICIIIVPHQGHHLAMKGSKTHFVYKWSLCVLLVDNNDLPSLLALTAKKNSAQM